MNARHQLLALTIAIITIHSCKKQEIVSNSDFGKEVLSAPNGNYWQYRTTFPLGTRREGAGCFVINGKAYIFGGIDEPGNYKKDLWQYDPVANTWTQKASLSIYRVARAHVSTFVINGKGYIVGGHRHAQLSDGNELTETLEYDPVANTWTAKQSLPMGRTMAAGFAINGKGYIAMGRNYLNDEYMSDVMEFDPVANTWTAKSELVSPTGDMGRYGVGCFVINNKAYIGLGKKFPVQAFDEFSDFWVYDPAPNTWTPVANFPAGPRSFPTAYSAGSIGYLGTGVSDMFGMQDFYSYSPSTNTWKQRAYVPGTPRAFAISFYIGNYGYLGLGFGYDPTQIYIYRYTAGGSFSPLDQN